MTKLMNVSFTFPPEWGGGSIINVMELCHIFKNKLDIYVYTGRKKNSSGKNFVYDYQWKGINVRSIEFKGDIFKPTPDENEYLYKESESEFNRYLEEVEPDIVHFHTIPYLGANLVKLAKNKNIPVVLKMADWWWFCPNIFLVKSDGSICPFASSKNNYKIDPAACRCIGESYEIKRFFYLTEILEHVDIFITPSDYLKKFLIAQEINKEKIQVIPNGVIPPRFILEKQEETITFGYVGGLGYLKGFDTLKKAIGIMAERIAPPMKWKLELWGCFENHFEKDLLAEKITDTKYEKLIGKKTGKGLTGYIVKGMTDYYDSLNPFFTFHPHVSYYPVFNHSYLDFIFSRFDCLLVPSVQRESYNSAIREALIRGIPVVSSDNGGAQEIIKDGENGMIFPTFDHVSLAAILEELLRSREKLERLKTGAGKTHVPTINDQALHYIKVYERLLNKSILKDRKDIPSRYRLVILHSAREEVMRQLASYVKKKFKTKAVVIVQQRNLTIARKIFPRDEIFCVDQGERFEINTLDSEFFDKFANNIDWLVIGKTPRMNYYFNIFELVFLLKPVQTVIFESPTNIKVLES